MCHDDNGWVCNPFLVLTTVCRVGLGVGELRPRLLALAALLGGVHAFLLDVGLDILAVLQTGGGERRGRGPPLGGGRGGAVDAEIPRCGQPGRGGRRRMHPTPRPLLAGDGGGDARPPRVYGGEGQRPVLVVPLPVGGGEALSEVLFVARGDFVLDEAHDVGEGERLLAHAAGQDVLVAVGAGSLCVCCNKTPGSALAPLLFLTRSISVNSCGPGRPPTRPGVVMTLDKRGGNPFAPLITNPCGD
jgi:hypothetical protein